MATLQRPSIPPLPSTRLRKAFVHSQHRLSFTEKLTSRKSSPASARGASPLGNENASFTEEKTGKRTPTLDLEDRSSFEQRTSELLRQHIQIGARIDFKAMSSAGKVTRSRLLESKCEKALQTMQEKQRRETKLPLSLMDVNTPGAKAFPCPLISLRGKAELRTRSNPRTSSKDILALLRLPATARPSSRLPQVTC